MKRLREEWDEIPNTGFVPNEIKSRMWNNIRSNTIDKYRLIYRWAAAACLLFILSAIGYQALLKPDYIHQEAIVTTTFPEDIRLLRLPDGTRVWLNQNTKIEYPKQFASNERMIKLNGEAFFEVKRDPSRPFIISSGVIKTTVLGTSFNVKAYNGNAPEVHVRTGKVKVESKQNAVFIEKGYAAIYVPTNKSMKKEKTTIVEPEWKKVLIDVDGLTLEQIIQKLESGHHFSIEYSSENLKQLKIRGTLDTRQGFSEMLQTIAFALQVDIKQVGKNNYVISE